MNGHSACIDIHILEPRRLFSWSTSDDFVQPLANPQGEFLESLALPADMAADNAGGTYACGESWDYSTYPSEHGYALLRYSSGAGAPWQTIAAIQNTGVLVARFDGVTVAPDGSAYLCGIKGGTYYVGGALHRIWKGTWDAAHTAFTVVEVDAQSTVAYSDISVDSAGNVFALGQYTTSKGKTRWVVRKKSAAAPTFATVDDFALSNNSSAYAGALTTVNSGSHAGVYVTGGTSDGRWVVRKSANAGTSWSTVDSFQLDPANNSPALPSSITASDNGTLYVAGRASVRVQTGGTAKRPIYGTQSRWFMRSSSTGGLSWTNHDVFPQSAGTATENIATAVATDLMGNVYVAGTLNGAGVVRTNAIGGGWSTSDEWSMQTDWTSSMATSMTRDTSGAIHVGGAFTTSQNYDTHWLVRSTTASGFSVAPSTGTPFNERRIGWDDDAETVEIVDFAA